MQSNKKSIKVPGGFKLILIFLFVLSLLYFTITNVSEGLSASEILASTLLLSIPLALLNFSVWLIVTAKRQKRINGRLSFRTLRHIHWTPRIAGIILAAFIASFSFDVFSSREYTLEILVGFLIHSIPSIVIGIIVFLSWKNDQIGFWAFLFISLIFTTVILKNPEMILGYILLFIGPMICTSILYWLGWKWGRGVK